MRGLAFPPNADADRETSYEYGTPISNVDDIPIDPALGGAAIDPALMMENGSADVVQPHPDQQYYEHPPPPVEDYQVRQYSQGPQGDPFAPQGPVQYFPIQEDQPPPPPPKPKRKRKVRKEEDCSFCQGNEVKNKNGEAELLITCHECGRSGHPTCMQLEKIADVMRSYPWKCIECKNCEVCQEKGDDDRILFCDWCDRGWHLDCMEPPLQEPPDGEWNCPICAPMLTQDAQMADNEYPAQEDIPQSPVDLIGEGSVASSSRSVVEATPTAPKRGRKKATTKGRPRAAPKVVEPVEGSDADEPDVEETPVVVSRRRGRPPKKKPKTPPPASSEDERPISPVRPAKRRRAPRPPRELTPPPAPLPRVRLRLPAQRGKGKEREEEEPHGLFDDILAVEERDTTKTTITHSDKLYFERSRITAEEKVAHPPPPPMASSSRIFDLSEDYISTRPRPLRSSTLQTPLPKRIDFSNSPGPSTPGGSSLAALPKFEAGVLRIQRIRFGPYDIKTWYDAPFPEEYANIPDGRLWICEFCLKYMKSRFGATRHQMKCKCRHPPGDEIYRDGTISIFEVDGRRNKIYCQNLCLLSKMFLDHKSLFYDVEPFLFYVITQVDDFGARFVGYFSKEKRCPKDYNLSCIMTLPVRQRQGWGNLLIDFSYLLSKIEQRLGSPEKPLSSLGALGYKNYWTLALMRFLQTAPDNVRIEEICAGTSMMPEDICNTLIQQNMMFIREVTPPPIRPSPGQAIKFPKGRKNGVARKQLQRMQTQDKDADGNKGPFIPPKHYEIHFDREKVDAYMRHWEAKGYLKLKPERLQWTPYLVSRLPQEPAVMPMLPAMDTADDITHTNGTAPHMGPFAQPTTPGAANGFTESPVAVDDDEPDELPMMVDTPSVETRTRTRSSVKSPTKEKDPASSPSSSPTAPLAPSRSLRTRSSNANLPPPMAPPQDIEALSVRSTRRGNTRKSSSRKTDAAGNDDDEALAAKLAMEETQMQSRQLRSRRSESQMENKKPAPAPRPIKPLPGRKRRRIESSPEVENSPAPEAEPAEEEEVEEEIAAATMEVDEEQLPVVVETQTPENTVVDVKNMDVKSEDAGTPLTNPTSRHSVPSDDTVFMTDHKAAEKSVLNYAESDLRSTLMDELHDEDAEGEYEEDAEGSPDADY